MRIRVAVLSAAVVLMAAVSLAAAAPIDGSPRVRPATPASESLITTALEKSATIRDLTKKLEQGNVVAYVHLAQTVPFEPESSLRFVGRSALQRFVIINVGSNLPLDRQIALLGHELHHVTEVARATWVSNHGDLLTAMSLIGWRDVTKATGFDTSAANRTERQIAKELSNPAIRP